MKNSTSLFDYFSVDADMGRERKSDDAIPLSYKRRKAEALRTVSGTFEPYRISTVEIDQARNHGTALVESSVLASVSAPMPSYRPMLEPSLVSRGVLSAEQLEVVIYAGEQHRHTFQMAYYPKDEDGRQHEIIQDERYGYFIGDGTGVGKGRQSAAIIRDNFNQGRRRAVWLSQSQILANDAQRDWVELGGSARDVISWNKYSIDDDIEFTQGILFGTYALLRSVRAIKMPKPTPTQDPLDALSAPIPAAPSPETSAPEAPGRKAHTRLDQLVRALGASFDGVIILDEVHNAGNADPMEKGATASLQGRAVLELQRLLPAARIVYVSATGASRVDALAYAPRLGLWAHNGAFGSRDNFMNEMMEAGTSALEMITRDLKALGRMSTRSLSYEGITYKRLEYDLDEEEISLYNAYNEMWRSIANGFKRELLHLGAARQVGSQIVVGSNAQLAGMRGAYQSRRQQFYAQVLLQFKMPGILAFAQAELDAGRSIIMQLTHTNEAAASRAIAKAGEDANLDEIDLTQRDLMLDYIRTYYPIHRYHYERDSKNNLTRVERDCDPITGAFVVDPAAVDRRAELLEKIETLLVCRDGPLEMIYDAFGEELVAEVTGRSRKIVMREDPITGERTRAIVSRGANENKNETEAFNNGPKRILVFSEQAGGTGRSYHADIRFKNHQPRTHIMLEMSWRAESCVQSLGRSHRSNQVCPPRVIFPTTNVPGEKRFASTPARRIAALGALSRGDRTAAGNGLFRPEDNLETEYAHEALQQLFDDINADLIPELPKSILTEQLDLEYVTVVAGKTATLGEKLDKSAVTITKFLNRLLCCDVAVDGGIQGYLMDHFMARIQKNIENAIAAGSYDIGVQTIPARSIVVKKREVIAIDPLSRATTELLTIQIARVPNTLSYDSCLAKIDHYAETFGPNAPHLGFFDVGGRIELRVPTYTARDDAGNPLVRVYGQLAVDTHTLKVLELSVATPVDRNDARSRWNDAIMAVPTTPRKINAIAGAITPIWNHLPWLAPEIYQMTADDGERIIGRVLTEAELEKTMASLAKSSGGSTAALLVA